MLHKVGGKGSRKYQQHFMINVREILILAKVVTVNLFLFEYVTETVVNHRRKSKNRLDILPQVGYCRTLLRAKMFTCSILFFHTRIFFFFEIFPFLCSFVPSPLKNAKYLSVEKSQIENLICLFEKCA